MSSLKEKVGYGFGDMSSSMYWKIFSAYLPFFYAQIFGLSLAASGTLMLVARIWDAITDPMMGIIADRTQSRWGKYRPYLLWVALPFAVSGVMLLTTPDWGEGAKLAWAYFTYLLMMTVYTAINVPYGSMLAVMTDDSDEKTVFSSFRMFFAYAGSFIVLAGWEPLCNLFSKNLHFSTPKSWQFAMMAVAGVCLALFLLTFAMTREHVHTAPKKTAVATDLLSLLQNGPWWILLGAVLFFNFFNAIRYAVIPFFFTSVVGDGVYLTLGALTFLFYAGIFLSVGEVANMFGVATTPFFTRLLGKKSAFAWSLVALIATNIAFYFVPTTPAGFWMMMALQIIICILTGIVSPLMWSMYADISDYAELKFHTASTGLIFSSSSMAQKFGGAIGGAAVLWILAAVGYNTEAGAVQTADAVEGLKLLMSWLPAGIAVLSLVFVLLYPLTTEKMRKINAELKMLREAKA